MLSMGVHCILKDNHVKMTDVELICLVQTGRSACTKDTACVGRQGDLLKPLVFLQHIGLFNFCWVERASAAYNQDLLYPKGKQRRVLLWTSNFTKCLDSLCCDVGKSESPWKYDGLCYGGRGRIASRTWTFSWSLLFQCYPESSTNNCGLYKYPGEGG